MTDLTGMTGLTGAGAIVTGASKGIGEATARRLAEAGATVVLAARSTGEIERIAGEIRAAGGRALAVACDVAKPEDVQALVEAARAEAGRLDILVNNAGLIEPIARLTDNDPAAWAEVLDVNVKGVYYGLRYALPVMQATGGGTIINLSSGAATLPFEGWSHYCASKAAVLALTKCTDLEYRDAGIRVVGLSPGTVATGMQVAIKASGINPVSELDPNVHIPPDWVARTIVYLCGPEGAAHAGTDVSLRSEAIRRAVGLTA
ncbi:SDR family oxidoreductase [Roseospira marina]|nr:SDR family oxidoreductase [Roseospira marina]MBB4313979.1 NAD(P)-dependent dehydrogenase (short-subunit alcohol dehydrogenase family) [Roseospira marina]MBB5087141.1 NAD(P)-dependent dehydrogenase (short-subunit alcohol dehydrogenase family) [Roseospira marina]